MNRQAVTTAALVVTALPLFLAGGCANVPTEGCQTDGYIRLGSWEMLDCYAQMGNRESAMRLGEMFERGEGVPQNFSKAVSYYALAGTPFSKDKFFYVPKIGHADSAIRSRVATGIMSPPLPQAQFALARLYAEGRGVKRDIKAARHWANLALQGGEPAAEELLRTLNGVAR